jgi:hypothetical protein
MASVTVTIVGADGAPLEGQPVQVENGADFTVRVKVDDPVVNGRFSVDLQRDDVTKAKDQTFSEDDHVFEHSVKKAAKGAADGKWTAILKDDGKVVHRATAEVEVTSEAAGGGSGGTPPPGVYDPRFAGWVGGVMTLVAIVLVGVLLLVLFDRPQSQVPVVWLMAFGLFILGVILGVVGAFLVAVEVRGTLRAAQRPTVRAAVDIGEAAKLVEAVGKLKGPTAVLALAAVCLIGAAWIGYGSTKPGSPATPTPAGVEQPADSIPATTDP